MRRPELPRVPALVFYPQYILETVSKYARFAAYGAKWHLLRKRLQRDPANNGYSDFAITPVVDAEREVLEMFDLNEASRAAVDKARRQADAHKLRAQHAEPAEILHVDAAE